MERYFSAQNLLNTVNKKRRRIEDLNPFYCNYSPYACPPFLATFTLVFLLAEASPFLVLFLAI
jgi:hypothetical protein